MSKTLKYIFKKFASRVMRPLIHRHDRNLLMSAKLMSSQNNLRQDISDLSNVEFSVFSQWGEDGIISWLVDKIDDIPNTFIEFGVEDYIESNTRYLLTDRNWTGLILDGGENNIRQIRNSDYNWKFDLQAKQEFISAENINHIIAENNFDVEIGLLSIDIDGNDYWVWKAINCIKPIIVVVEYNALLGDIQTVTIPYDSKFVRTSEHFSNVYFGASLQALCELGKEKGYEFVGTNSSGVNAFFVRSDKVSTVLKNIHEVTAYPSKFREGRNVSGVLTLDQGISRCLPIKDSIFVDLSTSGMKLKKLGDFDKLYSENWLAGNKVVF